MDVLFFIKLHEKEIMKRLLGPDMFKATRNSFNKLILFFCNYV